MLKSLHVTNIAIIDSIQVDFTSGLNLMTGETGAGKSIIIDSLGLALGNRAGAGLIKQGETSAEVTAVFATPDDGELNQLAEQLDLELEEELILRRRITASGSSRSFINDVPVNLKTMARFGGKLVAVHGQGEGDMLLSEQGQLILLDEYARAAGLRLKAGALWSQVRMAEEELARLTESLEQRKREKDFIEFQMRELEKAELSVEEEVELESEFQILQNAELLKRLSGESYYALYEDDDSLLSRYARIVDSLEEIAGIDQAWKENLERVEEIRIQIQELAGELNRYSDSIEHDEERLTIVEQRLSLYSQLQKKHGTNTAGLLQLLEKLKDDHERIDSDSRHLTELEQKVKKLKAEYARVSSELTELRKQAAEPFASEIEKHLKDLAMEKAQVQIDVAPHPRGETKTGVDSVEFFLRANPGGSLRPLARVASGGEQSRLMLAIQSVVLNAEGPATYIFDEIDAGIGGRVAEFTGRKLRGLAEARQILCITHLAQVAAHAHSHFVIEKNEQGSSTSVSLRQVDKAHQVEELARMLGGEIISDNSRTLARELLNNTAQG